MITPINNANNIAINLSHEKVEQKTPKDTKQITEIKDYCETSLQGFIYYQGERMSQQKLVEIALETNAIKIDENTNLNQAYNMAWKALVEDKAKPLYSWSTSLYSEDGKYKFRVEDGIITGGTLAQDANGVTFQEMAEQLANGAYPYEVKGDIFWLIDHDRELFDAACNIGYSKRRYEELSTKYNNNEISLKDYQYEMEPLLLMMIGVIEHNSASYNKLSEHFNREDFGKYALENYSPIKYKILNEHKPII